MARFRGDSSESDDEERNRDKEWKTLLSSIKYIKDNVTYEDELDQVGVVPYSVVPLPPPLQ